MDLTRSLVLALFLPALAQAQYIRGAVVEGSSDRPIPQAKIEAFAADGTVSASALSSGSGWFQLFVPSGGQFVIRASQAAFSSQDSVAVTVGAQETITVVLRLQGGPIPLDPVVVNVRAHDRLAGFRERARRAALGRFITRAEIDRYGAYSMADALRFTPEIRIEPVQQGPFNSQGVFMRNFGDLCVPTVFLDGAALPTGQVFDISELLPVEAIEGIEVYRSFLNAPLEFRVHSAQASLWDQSMCGVIVVWSRPLPRRPFTMTRVLFAGLLVGTPVVLARLFR